MQKIKILFLCTGNSCRSQMAESLCKCIKRDSIQAYSAGVKPVKVNPLAIEVMKEKNIDISGYRSKSIEEFKSSNFDYIITLCDSAKETCPYFPGKIIHHGFGDPPAIAKKCKTKEEKLRVYKKIRDEIEEFVQTLPYSLLKEK